MLYEPPAQGHLGTEKTKARFTHNFYWPNVRPRIIEFVRKCRKCAIRKPSIINTTAPLQKIKVTKPLELLELDLSVL